VATLAQCLGADGLAPGELESQGAFRRTLRQFLAAHADLRAEICDAILPNPDREKGRS
jgi:transaldolase